MQQWSVRLLTRGWPDQIIFSLARLWHSTYHSELLIKLLLATIARFLDKFSANDSHLSISEPGVLTLDPYNIMTIAGGYTVVSSLNRSCVEPLAFFCFLFFFYQIGSS